MKNARGVIISGVLVATGIGMGVVFGLNSADPTKSPEYEGLVSAAAISDENTDNLEADLEDVKGELATTKVALGLAQDEVDKVAQEKKDLKAWEKRLDRKTDELNQQIHRFNRTSLFTDGVFEVGRDMQPGTYRSGAQTDCYWSINGDANGDDIIANHYGDGPAIASVSTGQFFETSGCAAWVKQ